MAVNFETDTAIQHYLDTALVSGFTCLARILDIAFYNVLVFTIRQYLFVTLNTDLVRYGPVLLPANFPDSIVIVSGGVNLQTLSYMT